MSNPRAAAGDGEGESKDNTINKAAGILVFSGIALSILKAIIPLKKPRNTETQSANESPLSETTQLIQVQPPRPLPPHEPFVKVWTYLPFLLNFGEIYYFTYWLS